MKSIKVLLTGAILFGGASAAFANHHEGGHHNNHTMKADIVETAVKAGQFKTLAAALTATGLVDVLKSEGPFTVFAPTDAAFAKLPKGTVEALLKDKEKLKKILLYHVVEGKAPAKAVIGMKSANTVAGAPVKIMVKDDTVYLNGSKVIKADIMTSNGIIHVIDTVLMPPTQ